MFIGTHGAPMTKRQTCLSPPILVVPVGSKISGILAVGRELVGGGHTKEQVRPYYGQSNNVRLFQGASPRSH